MLTIFSFQNTFIPFKLCRTHCEQSYSNYQFVFKFENFLRCGQKKQEKKIKNKTEIEKTKSSLCDKFVQIDLTPQKKRKIWRLIWSSVVNCSWGCQTTKQSFHLFSARQIDRTVLLSLLHRSSGNQK